jgi:ATP adenylyltransferase
MSCPFCTVEPEKIVAQTALVFAVEDRFPVSAGHLLLIPKAHRKDLFELTRQEHAELHDLMKTLRDGLVSKDPTITGFNVGANCGVDAGQTVFHCHVHLIPRRKGDDPSPRGGVRAVIPGKKGY